MKFTYTPAPEVCSEAIHVEIENGKIKEVQFDGGCPGSLTAVSLLVKGLAPEEAIQKISGVRCGRKQTSCPDQLARALKEWQNRQQKNNFGRSI